LETEALDMDAVYDALDAFSIARRLARGADTEIEA
jgi:hypothetical protein